MTPLFTITSKGEGYTSTVYRDEDNSRFFLGDMDNDVDGSPFWHKDPCGQPGTSLHFQGRPIDSSKVPGIVLPPICIKEPKEIVLGCRCTVTHLGLTIAGVVFDTGPNTKLGEGSYAMLKALGLPALENGNGGHDSADILYRYWPGVPAVVNGIIYKLQPSF